MNPTIIAIDPGKSGGIAYQHPGEVVTCLKMPDTDGDIVDKLRSIAATAQESVCYLEDIVRFTHRNRQTGSSSIVYGRNWGFVAGVVRTLCIRLEIVNPRKWASSLGLGTRGELSQTKWKNKLKDRAQQLFPITEGNITLATSDALLILEYARRTAK